MGSEPSTTRLDGLAPPPGNARGALLAALILAECERKSVVVGSRLPTERQLATELGVTRAAVRQALSFLEAAGRVSREIGRGTFLRDAQPVGADGMKTRDGADDIGPTDVMSARELFEPQILPLVIARASARDFDNLDRCLRGGESADSAETWEAWDDAFHHAIVAAAHNQLLLRMYAPIAVARHGPLWGNLKLSHDSGERRTIYRQDHRDIVDALRARELEPALRAMRSHLARVRTDLLGAT